MTNFDKNNKNSFFIILKSLNILYVEDEKNINENISKALELLCSKVFSVENVVHAYEILENNRIDIIISDINLPKKDGIDFVKDLRENGFDNPIILLSAYTDKKYLLEAAKLKLVDYLVKPIDFNALNQALLNACEELIKNGKYIIDFPDNISYNLMQKKLLDKTNNTELTLTAKEIDLLDYLIKNSNRVVTHDELKEKIWLDAFEATDSALKNLLNKLRKKIGKNSIENISGVGFRINFS